MVYRLVVVDIALSSHRSDDSITIHNSVADYVPCTPQRPSSVRWICLSTTNLRAMCFTAIPSYYQSASTSVDFVNNDDFFHEKYTRFSLSYFTWCSTRISGNGNLSTSHINFTNSTLVSYYSRSVFCSIMCSKDQRAGIKSDIS